MDSPPVNDVLVANCVISACKASGNGGGLYVTIRGKLTVVDTSIQGCSALDEAAIRVPKDSRMVEGMGGGIHASAGGYAYIQVAGLTGVQINNNSAAVSGGGLSIKSGKAFVQGSVTIQGNNATNGVAADGYGNGGGVFVTTSLHDDNIGTGAGWGAATLYNDHGYLSSVVSGVMIIGNRANRWGGGLYAGISPPWYGMWPLYNTDKAKVTINNATVQNNTNLQAAIDSPLMPAQIAAERVAPVPDAILDMSGAAIDGNPETTIGIYALDSIVPVISETTTFGNLPVSSWIIQEWTP